MLAKPIQETASIIKGAFCNECGWPVISACCNDETAVLFPNDDYMDYCTNKGCKNHVGEAWSSNGLPTFIIRSKK